jgi:hypothetical protein
MSICITCGMPMEKVEDFACQDLSAKTCIHCTNADGSVKSCEEIFEGGVVFFMQAMSADRDLAEKLVRKNMLQLPYWKTLAGPLATDEEFAAMMAKLS